MRTKSKRFRYAEHQICPLPETVKGLTIDHNTGLYQMEEDGIKYYMRFENLVDLKVNYNWYGNIKVWYNNLDLKTQATITKTHLKYSAE